MVLPSSFTLRGSNNTRIDIPSVGFGTWASGNTSWAEDSILTALKAGYRHLDCAWVYGVDGAVGSAIRRSGIPRNEIFITTKFWPQFGHPDDVELCLNKCIEGMGVGYVDLWLAHWPCVWHSVSRASLEEARAGPDLEAEEKGILMDASGKPSVDWEHTSSHIAGLAGRKGSFLPTWKAMQDCVRKGKARSVGVSNFTILELQELLPHSGEIPLSCNQVEIHPWLPQNDLVAFCKKEDILVTCYSPFAGQKEDGATLLKDPFVKDIARKNGMDVGQLLQSWAVSRGTVPLGKSQTAARIMANLAVGSLSDDDMAALNSLEISGERGRTVNQEWDVPFFSS